MASKMTEKSRRMCDICTQAPGRDFCNECEQVFCRNCKILHMRTKSNRFHTFRNNGLLSREMDIPVCELHSEEFLYYCEKCEDPTCKVCISTTHKGHNMAEISEMVTKKRNELSSRWETYYRKLEGARKNVTSMENSLVTYGKKIHFTIGEIKREGDKLKAEIDKTVSVMIKELREKEREEISRISNVIDGLERQIQRGVEMEQNISKTLKLKNDTSLLISLQKFQQDMESQIPEVVLPCDFSYIQGNTGFANAQTLLGRIFFENEKKDRETPFEQENDFRRNVKRFDLWVCQLCNSERYIDHTEVTTYKTPRCCYGFMVQRGNVYK